MINSFIGKYYFLSPMYPCTINFSSIEFKRSEALYKSYKVYSFSDKCMFGGIDGSKARHIGNSIDIRDDWNEVKNVCLYRSLYYKFEQNPELAKRLLPTGD